MNLCGLVNANNLCLLYKSVPFVYLKKPGGSYSGLLSEDMLLGDSIRSSEVWRLGGLESYTDT